MNVLIVGCGKTGSLLARLLDQQGHNVSVVDQNGDLFAKLGEDFNGVAVAGMPMDMDVLRNAGIECCDAVAVTTADDNLNITVSQIVKTFFQVENVVTRISDSTREAAFQHLGLASVCSTNLVVSSVYAALTQPLEEKQFTFLNATMAVNAVPLDSSDVGRNLDSLPRRTGESVIGVLHPSGSVTIDDGEKRIELHTGDRLLTVHGVD